MFLKLFSLDIHFLLKRKHHCCASKSFKLVPHEMKEGLLVKILERRKKGSSLREVWQASRVALFSVHQESRRGDGG